MQGNFFLNYFAIKNTPRVNTKLDFVLTIHSIIFFSRILSRGWASRWLIGKIRFFIYTGTNLTRPKCVRVFVDPWASERSRMTQAGVPQADNQFQVICYYPWAIVPCDNKVAMGLVSESEFNEHIIARSRSSHEPRLWMCWNKWMYKNVFIYS